MRNVAIIRLEQIAPFPFDRVASIINRYPNAQLIWVQVWAILLETGGLNNTAGVV
jgi:2-oxoglutarate dehydrogenase complex dehydrogenase (E1) component-like enzyme